MATLPDVSLPDCSVYDLLFSQLRDRHALALTDPSGSVTYGELRARINAYAALISPRPGEVIGLQMANSIDFAVAFHAIVRGGGTVAALNPLLTDAETAQLEALAGVRRTITALPPLASPPDARIDAPPADIAVIAFSSGTTGLPKAVALSRENIVANIVQTTTGLRANRMDPTWTALAPLPFSHIYGMNVLLNSSLYNGNHVVTMPRFELGEFLRLHEVHQVAWTYIAPPIATALASSPLVEDYDLSSLQVVLSGAASLDAELARAVERRLGVDVIQGYGMTETSPVTHMMVRGDAMSLGRAMPHTQIKIVDAQGRTVTEPGRAGQMWVKGPQVMRGYLGHPDPTDGDGWLATGDLVELGEDGAPRLVDRIKEIINYKGYQVAPAELEAVLLAHPDIIDAAVTAVSSAPYGFVVPRPGAHLDPAAVIGWVAQRVAPYKKLRGLEMVGRIPRSAAGKILRRELAPSR